MIKVTIADWLAREKADSQEPDFKKGFAAAQEIVARSRAENKELWQKTDKRDEYTLIFNLLYGTHITNMLYHDTPKRTPMFIKGFNAAATTFSHKARKQIKDKIPNASNKAPT